MTTYRSIAQSRSAWEQALDHESIHTPFSLYGWHTLWYDTLGKTYEPLIVSEGNAMVSLAIAGDHAIFSGGTQVSDYQDAIGADAEKPRLWDEVRNILSSMTIPKLILNNVPALSATYTYFSQKPHTIVSQEDTTPLMPLPATWDAYVSGLSRKHRHELRRKLRKFEREHENIDILESTDLTADIDALMDLMRRNPKKATFLTRQMEEFFRGITQSCTRCSRLLSIVVDGHRASSIFYFDMDDTVFLYNSGFDEAAFSGAGFYLKAMSIKRAIEAGRTTYNFLQGNERYKYELGGQDFGVYKIVAEIR